MLILTHDVTSPASAVAVERYQRLADDGVPIGFRGLDVGGVDATLPVTLDVLAELDRVRPRADELGIELRTPTRRPPTAAVHLLADLAEEAGLAGAWRRATYGAYWRDDADLGDHDVLVELATGVGLGAAPALRLLADRVALAAVRRRTETARREGIGGVPVLVAHGTLLDPDLDEGGIRALAVG